jgi:hypothetical protein
VRPGVYQKRRRPKLVDTPRVGTFRRTPGSTEKQR